MKIITSKKASLSQKLKKCHETGKYRDLKGESIPIYDLQETINSLKLEIDGNKENCTIWASLILAKYDENRAKFNLEIREKITNHMVSDDTVEISENITDHINSDCKFREIFKEFSESLSPDVEFLFDDFLETFIITRNMNFMDGIMLIYKECPLFLFKYLGDLMKSNIKELNPIIDELKLVYDKAIYTDDRWFAYRE